MSVRRIGAFAILLSALLPAWAPPAGAQVNGGYPAFPFPLTTGNCIRALNAYQGQDAGAPCGTGSVGSGTINQLAWYAATGAAVSGLATANNGTLVTSGGGVPSISSTLPNAVMDNITRLGTVTSGTWNATVVAGQYGGTGVANTGKTITLGGNLTTSGNFAATFTLTNTTGVTFPTTGTLATLAGAEALTNKTITTFGGALTFNPANANFTLSPTGTGTGAIAPATAGTIDNMAIGGTTPLAGRFTTGLFGSGVTIGSSTSQAGGLAVQSAPSVAFNGAMVSWDGTWGRFFAVSSTATHNKLRVGTMRDTGAEHAGLVMEANGDLYLGTNSGTTTTLQDPTLIISGAATFALPPRLPPYTVGTLPTCNAGAKYSLAAVSDANSPTYNATVAGGGAVAIPVMCDGTNWTAH